MIEIPINNEEFISRLIKYTWIIDWLTDIKNELNNKLDKEDPDYLGHYLTECDILLNYLNC